MWRKIAGLTAALLERIHPGPAHVIPLRELFR